MSFPTQPAHVHFGDWDEETRKHPAQKWMEHIVHTIFDAHKWSTPYSDIYADDFTLLKPDGSEVKGGKAGWEAVAELYGPFVSQRTEPFYLVTTQTNYGWEMIGMANIFAILPGQADAEEEKVKDQKGIEWDVKMSGGFRFQYKRHPSAKYDGIVLQMVQITSDSGPVVKKMLVRGMSNPSDLGLWSTLEPSNDS